MIRSRCFARACAGGLLVGLCLLLAACASVPYEQNLSDYEAAIERLQRRVERNPDDADALRDLGVIHLRTSNFPKASEFLQMAFARAPDDPKTLFHLGLVNETLGKTETALRLYEKYPDVSRLSPYRRLMAGRYAWVVRRRMEEEVQARVRAEQDAQTRGQALCGGPLEPRVVAVYPLAYLGSDDRYAPLGRGLAELISIDLSHLNAIRLVERARLQDLLDEIRLSAGPRFDPATAPRVGCLVGAGRLVGGSYNVLGGDNLRLDANLWAEDSARDLDAQADALRNFIALEKRLVFDLIDEMGLELSSAERQRIEFVPTQNLQAFLAFSRGLEREDAGAFGEAAGFFGQAAGLDGNFSAAFQRAEAAEGMARAGGTIDDALTAAFRDDASPTPAGGASLMDNRLLLMNGSLGRSFVPGTEHRRPDDACNVFDCTRPPERLPDPPDPPVVPPGQRAGGQ